MSNFRDIGEPIIAQPLEVKVYNNFDRAMKAFRALVQKEKILSTYKEKSRYEKPSDKKRRKRNEMQRKMMELDVKFNLESQGLLKSRKRKEDSSDEG